MSKKKKMVKCLVCGEIFDASLEKCPVCGVGKENFVEIDPQETVYTKNTEDVYVILGNGAAGISAAKAVRERDRTGTILMVSDEPYPAYNRPMLTKAMLESVDPKALAVYPESWYEEQNIIQLLGRTVTGIDAKACRITLADGMFLNYDKLIYALGSESFVPPISGHEKEGVAVIRKIRDIEKIQSMEPKGKQVVVIGGGVLGLEAAWSLKTAGCQVSVLELSPQLMGRQLDEEAGELLKQLAAKAGIPIYTGVQIQEIQGETQVTGVALGDGTVLPANLVILSCGVRANTAVAAAAGITVDRAIVVNAQMETNLSGIFACGDCAQYEGINYALWTEASAQGEIAGANAAGEGLSYETISAGLSFRGMNTALFAIGDNGKQQGVLYEIKEEKDFDQGRYEKYYYVDGQLKGAILIGDVSKMAEVLEKIQK